MAFSLLSYGIFLHKITYSVSKLALIIIVTNMVYWNFNFTVEILKIKHFDGQKWCWHYAMWFLLSNLSVNSKEMQPSMGKWRK